MARVTPSLEVDLAGLRLRAAVLVASGCFGTPREHSGLVDLRRLGGVVTRSVTGRGRKGYPTPRLAERSSGLLTAIGHQNPGVQRFVAEELPQISRAGVPVIVSIAGTSLDEYLRVAGHVQGQPGVVALEVYVPSPDVERHGLPFTSSPEHAAEVVGSVARLAPIPVFAKLPPLLPGLVEIARACVRAGAHGVTLVDGVPGMGVDARTMRPALGAVEGFLSGPAIRPIAVRAVFEVARAMPDVPIMGVGGVATGEDAAELILAGAWAVQVGSAALIDPGAPVAVADGLLAYLREKGLGSPADLRGRLRLPQPRDVTR